MSLSPCSECGKDISSSARACPGCGAPNKIINQRRKIIVIATVIALAIVVFIFLIVRSPAGKQPDGMSNDVYKLGINALNITDAYLNGEMDTGEAVKKLDNISGQLEKIDSLDALTVKVDITLIRIAIESIERTFSSTTRNDIIENRNNLAEKLNQKQRK